MPLYEVVLRSEAGDEVRLADQDCYEQGARVVIDYRTYVVVGTEPPPAADVRKRFVLEPVDA
jgi:hypothetical protein